MFNTTTELDCKHLCDNLPFGCKEGCAKGTPHSDVLHRAIAGCLTRPAMGTPTSVQLVLLVPEKKLAKLKDCDPFTKEIVV